MKAIKVERIEKLISEAFQRNEISIEQMINIKVKMRDIENDLNCSRAFIDGKNIRRCGNAQRNLRQAIDYISGKIHAQKNIAQECYNQCLAVECGHGECCEAIYSRMTDLVSKYNAQN